MDAIDDDEYESLPTSNLYAHMCAGAMAGMMEHCAMYPVDLLKTRQQSLSPSTLPVSIYRSLQTLVQREGFPAIWRGFKAVALGSGPAHALYFSSYEICKEWFGGNRPGQHPFATGFAGMFATLVHDGFMNPFDVIKQRMQVEGTQYKTALECARAVQRNEGVWAFYRSYTTQLTMNIPFQMLHFASYDSFQKFLNPAGTYDPMTHMIAGAGAGALAAAATTPLDVAKTLLNTQENLPDQRGRAYINGMVDAVRTIYRVNGLGGFTKGLRARVVFQMPSTALSWSVYEFFKHILTFNESIAKAAGVDADALPELHKRETVKP